MKKCFHCGELSTCFTFHHEPPLEPNREGHHFWNFMESDDSFHFDIKCTTCNTLIKLDEMVGLTRCIGCDKTCQVGILMRQLEPENTQVYIVLGCRPIEERKQLDKEKFDVLQDYFDQQCASRQFKIKIVYHEMVKNLDRCYAEVIKDADALFKFPAGKA